MLDSSSSTEPDIVLAAQVLDILNAAAATSGVEVLVVGATARNILCTALFDRMPERATRDVDIAVAVPTWQAYQQLTADLTPRGGVHAFTVEMSGTPVAVDILPYGGIEAPDRTVHLPDEHTLNALGLREASDTAQLARLPGGVQVRVPTVAGLTLLKLVAWSDRHLLHRRDAVDLDEVIGWYAEPPLLDALYDDVDLLARYDFDLEPAAAHRLGADIGAMLAAPSRAEILAILNDDHRARLSGDMGRAGTRHPHRLHSLTDGIREAAGPP
jgi:predicted nucleotidyltransferase